MCILRLNIYNFLKHVSHYLENFVYFYYFNVFSNAILPYLKVYLSLRVNISHINNLLMIGNFNFVKWKT